MSVTMRTNERRESVHARRLERREELLRAAMDVIRHGGADATMEEMASAGGISKPILYRHFTDREGLVTAITEHALGVLARIIDEKLEDVRTGNWRDTVRATIAAFFEYVEREPELYRFVIEHDARQGSKVTHAFTEKMAEHVATTIATGLGRAGLDTAPAEVWGRAIIGMVQSVGDWWVAGSATSREDVVASLTDLAWAGIRGGPHDDLDFDARMNRSRGRTAAGE